MKRMNILCTVALLLSVLGFIMYNFRVFQTKDTLGPIIVMQEDHIYVSVEDDEAALLAGISAFDATNGDVTSTLTVENMSDFVENTTRYINYAAFDKDNHVSKASRKLTYMDYTPIKFGLDGPLRFPASDRTIDILGRVHATDCLDGDISDQINFSVNSIINVDTPATYKVVLEVTNSAGDMQSLPVNVTIYDRMTVSSTPQIMLTDYLIYVRQGAEIDPSQYLEGMYWHGTEYAVTDEKGTFGVDTSKMSAKERKAFQERDPEVARSYFQIADMVDYNTPGVYEIQYTLDDEDGNRGSVSLVVIVE